MASRTELYLKIGGLALVDARTAARYMRGERCQPASARAIRSALRTLGIADPQPEPPLGELVPLAAISAAPTPQA